MRARTLTLVAAVLLAACSARAPAAGAGEIREDFVQAVIYNRTTDARARLVYARFDAGSRIDLGQLARGESMVRTLLMEGGTLSIAFDPGPSSGVSVIAGERIEFVLDDRGVHTRRLPSRVRNAAGN